MYLLKANDFKEVKLENLRKNRKNWNQNNGKKLGISLNNLNQYI